MPLVAVTGATGFVGGALCRQLRKSGYGVVALARNGQRAAPLAALGCRVVPGDLADRQALDRLVDAVDCVVHCAAAVRGRSLRDFRLPNVEGTATLLDALQAAGTPRLLHLSSLAAREPSLSWYSASKREAEALLQERAPASLAWCALRPPAVYGPGDRELLGLWRLTRRGFLPTVAGADARLSLIHIDDLVAALERLCSTEVTLAGDCFDIADSCEEAYSWRDLARITGDHWQRPVQLLPLPGPALAALAWANLGLAHLTRSQPMLSPGKLRELRHRDWSCGHGALSERSGWQPRRSLAEGLATLNLDAPAGLPACEV